jgi:excisionase family DNA binding protein
MPGIERLLTVGQVADWLQLKPRTVYQWVHEGYIPVIKLGTLVRFSQASVSEWLRRREAAGRQGRRLEFDVG